MSLAAWPALRTPTRKVQIRFPRARAPGKSKPWQGRASFLRALALSPVSPRTLRPGLPKRSPRSRRCLEAELHARVLPTAWQAAELMPQLYETLQPHVMIHFGVSQRAKSFRIERFAHNRAALTSKMPTGRCRRGRPSGRLDPPASISDCRPRTVAAHLRASGLAAVPRARPGPISAIFSTITRSIGPAAKPILDSSCSSMSRLMSGQGGTLGKTDLLRGAHETLRFVLGLARAERAVNDSDWPGICSERSRA